MLKEVQICPQAWVFVTRVCVSWVAMRLLLDVHLHARYMCTCPLCPAC
jgi:hypothetical protein